MRIQQAWGASHAESIGTGSIVNKGCQEKLTTSLSAGSLFGFTLFFFGPALLYFTNILEYSSSFSDIAPFLVILSLTVSLLMTLGLIFLKHSIYQRALSFVFFISLLLWFQGNILVWQYGLLDGRDIDWSSKRMYGLIDSGIWIVLIIASFIVAPYIRKMVPRASVSLLVIQLVSTLFLVIRAPDASAVHRKTPVNEEAIFEFSSEKNVVILLLDSFQTDVFQEIINKDPYYRKMFDGFTYYRNSLGGFPKTYASVSLLLTGQYYDNSMPVQDFIKKTFSAGSVPKILTSNGYRVDLIGGGKTVYADETIAASCVEIEHLLEKNVSLNEALFLLDLTLFRYLPHFLKKHVYNNQAWLISNVDFGKTFGGFPAGPHRDSIEFMRKLGAKAKAGGEKPTFKYIHLFPPHSPLRFNEKLEHEDMPGGRGNYMRQAMGCLELTNILLEALKNLGIYDNTMVLVLADSGWGYPIDVSQSGYRKGGGDNLWLDEFMKARALPFLLIKPFTSKGILKISAVPVSHGDVAKTILSGLGLESEVPGKSIFEIDPSEPRERRFRYYYVEKVMQEGHLPPLREFTVSGFSWLDRSWYPACRAYTHEGIKKASVLTRRNGVNIRFGEDGNSLPYLGRGWSYVQKGFTSTDGKIAALIVPIDEVKSDVELKVSFDPYIVPGKVDRQRVAVLVNGTEIDAWEIDRHNEEWRTSRSRGEFLERAIRIPNGLLTDYTMVITFHLPDAVVPAQHGWDMDERMLGIRLRSLALNTIDG